MNVCIYVCKCYHVYCVKCVNECNVCEIYNEMCMTLYCVKCLHKCHVLCFNYKTKKEFTDFSGSTSKYEPIWDFINVFKFFRVSMRKKSACSSDLTVMKLVSTSFLLVLEIIQWEHQSYEYFSKSFEIYTQDPAP